MLIAISLLEMRKEHPELNRPYRIGKSGNFFAWVVSCMLIFSIVVVVFATLGTATMGDALLVTAIAVVMFVIPLIINHFKKDSWNTAVEASLEENLDEYSDQVTHSH